MSKMWKLCLVLLALVVAAAGVLLFVTMKAPVPGGDAYIANYQTVQPADSPQAAALPSPDPSPAEEESAEAQVLTGRVKTLNNLANWKGIFASVTKFPELAFSGERTDDGDLSHAVVSNSAGEYALIEPSRIYYTGDGDVGQIQEIIGAAGNRPNSAKDREITDEGLEALEIQLPGFTRADAERRAEEVADGLLTDSLFTAHAARSYAFSQARIERVHKALYKNRADWFYFQKEAPDVPAGGVYFVELDARLDGIGFLSLRRDGQMTVRQSPTRGSRTFETLQMQVLLSQEGVLSLNVTGYAWDGEPQPARAVPEENVKRAYAALWGTPEESLYAELKYVLEWMGSWKNKNVLPIWRVYELDQKDELLHASYFDALTGELIWEICEGVEFELQKEGTL